MRVTVSSSGIAVEVPGRLARVIAYLAHHQAALDMDASASGKLLILWGENWLRCRKEEDFPPIKEPSEG